MERQPYIMSFAQNREDVYIDWLLNGKKKGFYIDIGANDPNVNSVSKLFYQRGWHGINIEPITSLVEVLKRDRPRDINIQVGVSTKKDKIIFKEYIGTDGLPTFNARMQKENNGRKKLEYEVEVLPLRDILKDHIRPSQTIDFMKVGVEGYEYEVLESNDWRKYRPTLLLVGANLVKNNWRPLIEAEGYRKIFFDGLNEYYTTDKSILTKARESYPRYLIAPIILNQQLLDHLNFEKEKESKRVSLKLTSQLRNLEHDVAILNAQYLDIRFLFKRIIVVARVKILNRANRSFNTIPTLSYRTDHALQILVSKGHAREILEYIVKNDSNNITLRSSSFKKVVLSCLRRSFWLIVKNILGLMTRILGFIARKARMI